MPKEKEEKWERWQGESEQAFEAFKIYRDLGLKRSNREVCEKLSKSRQLISRWKSEWKWDERVRAYDNALEKEAHKLAVKELKDMTSRHIKISISLQNKALEALQQLSIEDMTPKDIKEYIKIATDLERLNRVYKAEDGETVGEDDECSVNIYMPEKEGESYE